MSAEILKTTGLGINFGGVRAVKSVDFTLRQGELRSLIGPNGAGKTTFFRMLSGQYQPSHGQIIFKGRPIQSLQPYQIARLGIAVKTQVPSLFEGLSVSANIELSASRVLKGKLLVARVEEVLERTSLRDHRAALCSELSHGLRQWVELGQILAARPALALLDEPAAGMTHSESRKTVEIIKEIVATSAVVVVEHDMDFIKMLGGEVTVFDRGSIIAEGSFQSVASDLHVREAYLGKRAAHDA